MAAIPEDQGTVETIGEQRAELPTPSPSTVDVTIQPHSVSSRRLASIKSWFADLSNAIYAESLKQFLPWAVKAAAGSWAIKVIARWFGISI